MVDGLCITVLTGRRLALLKRTLTSLRRADVNILKNARVIVYLNGKDEATHTWLQDQSEIDELLYEPSVRPEPIGDAVSRLVARVQQLNVEYHLHLEDDWECTARDSSFLLEGATVLQIANHVGQVRFRSTEEPTMNRHMVNNGRHTWKTTTIGEVVCKVSGLHFTFNPSLVRVRDLSLIYPAHHENVAARNYLKTGWSVAQLVPGVFRHIGTDSLRGRLGRA